MFADAADHAIGIWVTELAPTEAFRAKIRIILVIVPSVDGALLPHTVQCDVPDGP